jgi:hypothetical protein
MMQWLIGTDLHNVRSSTMKKKLNRASFLNGFSLQLCFLTPPPNDFCPLFHFHFHFPHPRSLSAVFQLNSRAKGKYRIRASAIPSPAYPFSGHIGRR